MSEVVKIVLSLSLAGSLLILILFLFRPVFKERLSKRWQYYIWLVVIARLLLPFAPETNLMGTLFGEIDTGIIQTEIVLPPEEDSPSAPLIDLPQESLTGDEQNNLQGEKLESPATLPIQNILSILWQNLWLGWLVVALILLIRKMTAYQSFVKYIRAGCVEVSDIELLERFGDLIEKSKIKTRVEFHTNSLTSSPLLIGFFRPCIVLPSTELSDSDFEYTILHELMHYKRKDMFYKWLVQITICLHWFNPLTYLMGREVGRACELACDETVIKELDAGGGQRAYGDTLLNAMGAGGCYKDSLASVTLNESKELLKERLDAIMGFKRKTKLTAAISIALTFAMCFGAMAVGVYAAPQTAIPKIPVNINTSNKPEVSYDKDYAKWNVTHIDDTYYYQNEPVRIFMDLRADNSFANFSYNENGHIDLRLVRSSSDSIVKVEYMSKAEADEILNDLDVESKKEDISRLTLEEVPDAIRSAINSCDNKTWYVIKGHRRQYIYYNNLPHNYAYQYEPTKNSIRIVDIGKSTGNYVLLSIPLNSNLTISYHSKSVAYKNVIGASSVPPLPRTVNGMTLVEKEYTIDELQSLNISGFVVEALSENKLGQTAYN